MKRGAAARRCCAPRRLAFVLLAAALFVALSLVPPSLAQTTLPSGFVYLRDIDPSIAQDIRYAGFDNFVGRPLPGYDAPECILRRDVAVALKQVEADLAASGLSVKVYDCYRPARAVRAMAQWAGDRRPGSATKRFFPKLQKDTLFALGYIASRSQHSTGAAVDLTLIERASAPPPPFDSAASYGACTAPARERAPDNSLDMGTGYDCFDMMSHTASAAVNAEQRRRRNLLLAAMAKRGFRNYHREWWHFSYPSTPPLAAYDFPIRLALSRERMNARPGLSGAKSRSFTGTSSRVRFTQSGLRTRFIPA